MPITTSNNLEKVAAKTPQATNITSVQENLSAVNFEVLDASQGGAAKDVYTLMQDPAKVGTVVTTALSKMGATVKLNADGTINYDPSQAAAVQALAAGQTAEDSFVYTIRLGNGALSTATIKATLTGVNDVATITGGATGAVAEDGTQTAAGRLVVTDVDTGQAALKALSPTDLIKSYGAFSLSGSDWSYALDNGKAQGLKAGQIVTETLTVSSVDGTASKTISVTLTGANDAPTGVATAKLGSSSEDTDITISKADLLAGFTDVDGDDLAISAPSADKGDATLNPDGSVTIRPTADYSGAIILSYKAVDGKGGTVSATQNLTVAAVNDAPVAVDDNETVAEDSSLLIDVLANDTDVDGPARSVVSDSVTLENPSQGSVSVVDGKVKFAGASNFAGDVVINYKVTDGDKTDDGKVLLDVTPVNDPHTGRAAVQGVAKEGQTLAADVGSIADADGLGAFRYTWEAGGGDTWVKVGTEQTFTQTEAVVGKAIRLSVEYTDGQGFSEISVSEVTPAVEASNRPPTASTMFPKVELDESTSTRTVSLLSAVSDPDGDVLGVQNFRANSAGAVPWSLSEDQSTLSVDTNHIILRSLGDGEKASFVFDYDVVDAHGASIHQQLTVDVRGHNAAPVAFKTSDKALTEDTAYVLKLSDFGFSDVDSSSTLQSVYMALNNTGTLRLNGEVRGSGTYQASDIAAGRLTWTPAADLHGPDILMFNYTVSDGSFWSTNHVPMVADIADVPDGPVGNPLSVHFDDLVVSDYIGFIPAGYKGFSWSGFAVMRPAQYPLNPSGYQAGMVSSPNDGWGSGTLSITRPTDFDFESGYFTAAWNNGQTLRVEGWDDGALRGFQEFVIDSTGPKYVELNDPVFDSVDRVVFSTRGGTDNPSYPGGGEFMVMDNLVFGI
ncbi:tandem-95 repeat protein [Roseomonas sp. GCM10028921]